MEGEREARKESAANKPTVKVIPLPLLGNADPSTEVRTVSIKYVSSDNAMNASGICLWLRGT